MQKSYTVSEATKKLEYYCAYQERCHEEVIAKLKSLNMIPQAIDAIIGHLLENDYLNEERFSKSFARGKFRIQNWGRLRIVRELKARKISQYNINIALAEIDDENYITTLTTLANKRWAAEREKNEFKKRKKIVDFLIRKGFENHLIFDVISSLK